MRIMMPLVCTYSIIYGKGISLSRCREQFPSCIILSMSITCFLLIELCTSLKEMVALLTRPLAQLKCCSIRMIFKRSLMHIHAFGLSLIMEYINQKCQNALYFLFTFIFCMKYTH